MPILLVIFLKCVIADHRQPEITDSSRQPLQDNTNRRDHTGQRSAANTENRNSAAGHQHQGADLHVQPGCPDAVRPSHSAALCAARRAAAEAAAAVAAAAAIAAEHRAADAEQRRQDRAAAAEQHRQDRAKAATLHKQLDSFEEKIFQHSKLQKLTDPRTNRRPSAS